MTSTERRTTKRRILLSPDYSDPRSYCPCCGVHASEPHLEGCDLYGEKHGSEDWTDKRSGEERRK